MSEHEQLKQELSQLLELGANQGIHPLQSKSVYVTRSELEFTWLLEVARRSKLVFEDFIDSLADECSMKTSLLRCEGLHEKAEFSLSGYLIAGSEVIQFCEDYLDLIADECSVCTSILRENEKFKTVI